MPISNPPFRHRLVRILPVETLSLSLSPISNPPFRRRLVRILPVETLSFSLSQFSLQCPNLISILLGFIIIVDRWATPRRSHQPLNQRKHYMAVEFEASKEIIGGSWYVEGKLDAEFIKLLKDLCLKHIDKLEVVTMEGLFDHFCRSGILKVKLSSHQIFKILQALVLDNEIEEVKSTGKGFFSSVPLGKFCYRHLNWRNPMAGFMSSIPCGVCPRISECTADGFISPVNCVYIKKWLDF